MSALTRLLWRTIWNTKGQFLAVVAVVTLGITVYISMGTAYYSLNQSQENFYRANNFADYYFQVVRAPQEITRQIESLPGVSKATGRIQIDVPVVKKNNQRATARLTSYPLPMANEVNRLHLLSGRLFDSYPQGGGIEVLLEPQYVKAHNLALNDQLTIVAENKQVPLSVVGTASSPEFIYPMKDAASLMPDPQTFTVVMIPQEQAQQLLNMPGQINQVVLKLAPGADAEKIAGQVKTILEPYGNLANYPREQQLSHAVLQGELDGLKATVNFLPLIFLGLAATIQLIMLGRMVKAQRLQIGVMKALGYNSLQVMLHYTGYALAIALAGALLGSIFGILLARVISEAYALFFNLPETIGSINYKTILYGFSLSLGVSTVAGITASRGVLSLNPAAAMRPEPPRAGVRTMLEQLAWLWSRLDPSWKFSLKAISRNRMRFGVTLVGVVFAVGMLVVSLFSNDSVDYMLTRHYQWEQQYDYLVRFATPVKAAELLNIERIEGVLKAEPLLEIPVRMHFNGRSEEDVLVGYPPNLTLKKLVDKSGQPLQVPEAGMLISRRTADKLQAGIGDRVVIETLMPQGPSRKTSLKIVGINEQLIGSSSYVSLAEANRVLQESQVVSGAMLKITPGQAPVVEEKLNEMIHIASILSRQKEIDNFNELMGMMIYSISIMLAFALLLGFAIVYNSAVVSFAERRRELASLRVIGFTNQEVSALLLKETLLQSLLGVALGLPFGLLLAKSYAAAVNTDLYTIPVVIYPLTYLLAALGGVLFIMLAHLAGVKGVKHLDLVNVLKNSID